MSRARAALVFPGLFAAVALAQQQPEGKKPEKQEPSAQEAAQLPPEEDTAAKPEEYSFNPVKSKRDVAIGEFYFKKGDFKAAAGRFREATKWNDGNADAWLRLGEAEEKRDDSKAARAAYEKYLQLAPDSRFAADVKRRLEKLKH